MLQSVETLLFFLLMYICGVTVKIDKSKFKFGKNLKEKSVDLTINKTVTIWKMHSREENENVFSQKISAIASYSYRIEMSKKSPVVKKSRKKNAQINKKKK